MKCLLVVFTALLAGVPVLVAGGDALAASKKWAAIYGSADRSAVGYVSNMPTRARAIAAAKRNCLRHKRTKKSCTVLRRAWTGSKCHYVRIRGSRRAVCNR